MSLGVRVSRCRAVWLCVCRCVCVCVHVCVYLPSHDCTRVTLVLAAKVMRCIQYSLVLCLSLYNYMYSYVLILVMCICWIFFNKYLMSNKIMYYGNENITKNILLNSTLTGTWRWSTCRNHTEQLEMSLTKRLISRARQPFCVSVLFCFIPLALQCCHLANRSKVLIKMSGSKSLCSIFWIQ